MGSPVSPVIANLYMEEIEAHAITNPANPHKVWDRYVVDVFSYHEERFCFDLSHELNSIDPHISFTYRTRD